MRIERAKRFDTHRTNSSSGRVAYKEQSPDNASTLRTLEYFPSLELEEPSVEARPEFKSLLGSLEPFEQRPPVSIQVESFESLNATADELDSSVLDNSEARAVSADTRDMVGVQDGEVGIETLRQERATQERAHESQADRLERSSELAQQTQERVAALGEDKTLAKGELSQNEQTLGQRDTDLQVAEKALSKVIARRGGTGLAPTLGLARMKLGMLEGSTKSAEDQLGANMRLPGLRKRVTQQRELVERLERRESERREREAGIEELAKRASDFRDHQVTLRERAWDSVQRARLRVAELAERGESTRATARMIKANQGKLHSNLDRTRENSRRLESELTLAPKARTVLLDGLATS